MPDSAPHTQEDHARHLRNSRWLTTAVVGGGLLTLGIIVAPHILQYADFAFHAYNKLGEVCAAVVPGGTGVAGFVSRTLEYVPLIGTELASGGIVNSLVSGAIGIGGALLGHYIDKRQDGTQRPRWGNIIRTAALITSAFVAAPALLPAIGMGITFIGLLIPGTNEAALVNNVLNSFGVVSVGLASASGGLAVGALVVPHLLTCGLSFGSAAFSVWSAFRGKEKLEEKAEQRAATEAQIDALKERASLARAAHLPAAHSPLAMGAPNASHTDRVARTINTAHATPAMAGIRR